MKRHYGPDPAEAPENEEDADYSSEMSDIDSREASGYYDNPGERVGHVFRDRRSSGMTIPSKHFKGGRFTGTGTSKRFRGGRFQ